MLSGLSLDSACTLQEAVQLALLGLEVGVTTNVFLGDEDVGHASLAGDFFEGILNGGAVICEGKQLVFEHDLTRKGCKHIPTSSNSIKKNLACFSFNSALLARQ
jgi:hypothetical protein